MPFSDAPTLISLPSLLEGSGEKAARGSRGFCGEVEVSTHHACQIIVDHDGRNCSGEAACSRQQRFGDFRGDNSQVCRLGFRNPNEAVHDAPNRSEKSDERSGGLIVASAPMPCRMRRDSERMIAAKRDAARSFISCSRSNPAQTSGFLPALQQGGCPANWALAPYRVPLPAEFSPQIYPREISEAGAPTF